MGFASQSVLLVSLFCVSCGHSDATTDAKDSIEEGLPCAVSLEESLLMNGSFESGPNINTGYTTI